MIENEPAEAPIKSSEDRDRTEVISSLLVKVDRMAEVTGRHQRGFDTEGSEGT